MTTTTKSKRRPKQRTELTLKESWSILEPIVSGKDFVKVSAHKKFPYNGMGKNVFRFTVNIISLDMLISIMEHPQVVNVYYTPSMPGPDQGLDGISLIYKIYVRYHPLPLKDS